MPDRSSKPPRNLSRRPDAGMHVPAGYDQSAKDPAAVSLGRRGGLKGGKARALRLSAERRQEIARLAATARWERRDE